MSDQESPNEGTQNPENTQEIGESTEIQENAPEAVEPLEVQDKIETKESIPKANNKKLIMLTGAVFVFMGLIIGSMSMCSKEEPVPTVDELRIQHLDYIEKFLASYKSKNGAYPQPTVRKETKEGMTHVWGYEKDVPALASCTAPMKIIQRGEEDVEEIDPENSHCGGNIYDLNGNLIGWKGTIVLDSGLNNISVEELGEGRIISPVSEYDSVFPEDPAFANYSNLQSYGFGEYVYAVRIPENAANDKGGSEYQIAVSIPDPDTGKLKTHIRGDYYVKTDERGTMPTSLIGSGILFNKNDVQVDGQGEAIQVLMNEQKEGLPHPSLGSGEEVLQILSIKQKSYSLARAIEDRLVAISSFTDSDSKNNFSASLTESREDIEKFIASLPVPGTGELSTESFDQEIAAIVHNVFVASEKFIEAKSEEVSKALEMEVNNRDVSESILRRVLNDSESIEDMVLLARDEVIKYLDGEGIEDQSRSRAGRKIEDALELVPNIDSLFEAQKLETPYVFLLEDEEEDIKTLASKEEIDIPEDETEEVVTVNKITSNLVIHIAELEVLLSQIIDGLKNTSSSLEEIDESLKKLSRALASENERIDAMFDDLASDSEMQSLLSVFNDKRKADGDEIAIMYAGARCGMFGNFSPLNLSTSTFDSLSAAQSPGIPFEDKYTGIPYPLP